MMDDDHRAVPVSGVDREQASDAAAVKSSSWRGGSTAIAPQALAGAAA
jgi:hypothetical protein